jgi:phospholipid-binding lipoprotein MlaA
LRDGPYLFIPVLGPSNPRDLTGFGLGIAADPFVWLGQGATVDALGWSRAGVSVVDTRESLIDPLDDLERSSLDPYATLRSVYRQRRRAEIENRLDRAAPAAAAGTGFGIGTGLAPER